MEKNILIETMKTLPENTAEFDYDKFKKILQDIMGAYTQKEFAEITGIANTHVSRVLNGHRTNQPTLKTVHKIAKAAKNPDQILKLFKATGYLQEGLAYLDEIGTEPVTADNEALSPKTMENERYHRMLSYIFKALEVDRGIKSRPHDGTAFSSQLYYELNCDLKEWHFFIADQKYESRDAIYMMYGQIASLACFKTTKFSIITTHSTVYEGFTKIPPYNLNANVSVILVDLSQRLITKECMLSSAQDPLPDELTKQIELISLFKPYEYDFIAFTDK